jgi:hypothetical protein
MYNIINLFTSNSKRSYNLEYHNVYDKQLTSKYSHRSFVFLFSKLTCVEHSSFTEKCSHPSHLTYFLPEVLRIL